MMVVVTGGSCSGKSAFAEQIVTKLVGEPRYYLATMKAFSDEDMERVNRHREMRKEKGFLTIEKPDTVSDIEIPDTSLILLECLSNLLANELFSNIDDDQNDIAYRAKSISEKIIQDVIKLKEKCKNLIIVTNEIFSDGIFYSKEVQAYQKALGWVNLQLAQISDVFYEVVCGIPICHKGE